MIRFVITLLGLTVGQLIFLGASSAQSFHDRVNIDAAAYSKSKITLTGRVVDERGRPIRNASIKLYAWGDSAANNGIKAHTNIHGRFSISGLRRRAVLVKVSRNYFYSELIPVDLQRPMSKTRHYIGKISLYQKRSGRARLIFGGDVMLGRRYLDHDGDGIFGEEEDLLRNVSLVADSKSVFRFVRQGLNGDDHTSINLETPVTHNPLTPHPSKSYRFYTHPESAKILKTVGIDSVSLGNNHVYDYLEDGFTDTLAELAKTKLRWFGAGRNDSAARANRLHIRLNGIRFGMQGFSELTGNNYGSESLQIVAKDTPVEKGGALELSEARLTEFVDQEAGYRFTIPVLHGGQEYRHDQTAQMRAYFKLAIEHGADMVVAHHPHVPHGVSFYNAGKGPRWIFGSLGNFVFDQQVLESFRSYLTVVDVQRTALGPKVKRVQLLPYRIDGYVPRFLTGNGLTNFARHIGHLSTQESNAGDGITGATVFEQKGRIFAHVASNRYKTQAQSETQNIIISDGESNIIEFIPNKPGDSMNAVQTSDVAQCTVGRDIYILGSFEEQDVDDAHDEGDLWTQSESRYVQNSEAHRGRGAMAMVRHSDNQGRTSTWLSHKLRVKANDRLTLTGYHKGENAGDFSISVRWMTGNSTFSQSTQYQRPPGTAEWQRFAIDLTVPVGADNVKIYYRHYPPSDGEGVLLLDDLALVRWQDEDLNAVAGVSLPGPNDWRFVRCRATEDGPLDLTLTRTTYSLN